MRDYLKLQSNHNLIEQDLEPEEKPEAQQPVVAKIVYNTHEDRNGKTIAITVSLQLPLQ